MNTILGHIYWHITSVFIVFSLYDFWPVKLINNYIVLVIIVSIIISWLYFGMNGWLSNVVMKYKINISQKYLTLIRVTEILLAVFAFSIFVQIFFLGKALNIISISLLITYLLYIILCLGFILKYLRKYKSLKST